MREKPLILCATDFSSLSKNAFHYALTFAKKMNGAIRLIYAQKPNVHDLEGEKRKNFQFLFEKFLEGEDLENIEVTYKIDIGFIVDALIEESKIVDFIVLGMRSHHSLVDKVVGTVSSTIIQEAQCPVLVIPSHCKQISLEHLVYATDFHDKDIDAMMRITDIAFKLNAKVDILHVNVEEGSDYKVIRKQVETIDLRDDVNVEFSAVTVKSDSVIHGIDEFVNTNLGDLVVMLTHKRSFIDQLFHKSQTQAMWAETSSPLLILHDQDHE